MGSTSDSFNPVRLGHHDQMEPAGGGQFNYRSPFESSDLLLVCDMLGRDVHLL